MKTPIRNMFQLTILIDKKIIKTFILILIKILLNKKLNKIRFFTFYLY